MKDETEKETEEVKEEKAVVEEEEEEEEEELDTFDMEITITEPFKKGIMITVNNSCFYSISTCYQDCSQRFLLVSHSNMLPGLQSIILACIP